jgi:hypothetical protein
MSQSRIFVGMVLILIFAEVLGLYGSVLQTRQSQTHMLTAQSHRRPDPEHESRGLKARRGSKRPCTTISCKLMARARSMQHVGVRDLDLFQFTPRAGYLIGDGDPAIVGAVFFLDGIYA